MPLFDDRPWEQIRDEAVEQRNRALNEVKAMLDRKGPDFWGMYTHVDIGITESEMNRAVKRLNNQLYRAIKDIPKYETISQHYIESIVINRMDPLREEFSDMGCTDSEGRYAISDTLELYFEIAT